MEFIRGDFHYKTKWSVPEIKRQKKGQRKILLFDDYIFGGNSAKIPKILNELWDRILGRYDDFLLGLARQLPDVPLYEYLERKREQYPQLVIF